MRMLLNIRPVGLLKQKQQQQQQQQQQQMCASPYNTTATLQAKQVSKQTTQSKQQPTQQTTTATTTSIFFHMLSLAFLLCMFLCSCRCGPPVPPDRNQTGLAFTVFPVVAVVILLVVLLQDNSQQPGVASLSDVLLSLGGVVKGGPYGGQAPSVRPSEGLPHLQVNHLGHYVINVLFHSGPTAISFVSTFSLLLFLVFICLLLFHYTPSIVVSMLFLHTSGIRSAYIRQSFLPSRQQLFLHD